MPMKKKTDKGMTYFAQIICISNTDIFERKNAHSKKIKEKCLHFKSYT